MRTTTATILETRLAERRIKAQKAWEVFSDTCDDYEAKKKAYADALHDDTVDLDACETLEEEMDEAEIQMTITYDCWIMANNAMCYAEQDLEEYERKHAESDDDNELIDPPEVDKAQLDDSLTRAMKIALEHYKGFCIVGNLTGAEHELKLYNICRKAKAQLGKE